MQQQSWAALAQLLYYTLKLFPIVSSVHSNYCSTQERENPHIIDERADYDVYYSKTNTWEAHMDNRTNKQNYYLDIADAVLERSTCLRRKYGAIIVRSDEIISTGYNGAPRGRKNCSDLGYCTRENLKIPSGERYELCRSVHAEANAIISASRRDMIGATIYLVGRDARTNELLHDAMSCSMCKRQIINAGIDRVVIRITETEYRTIPVSDWIENDDSVFSYVKI